MRTLRHLAAGVTFGVAAWLLTHIAALLDPDAEGWRLEEIEQ